MKNKKRRNTVFVVGLLSGLLIVASLPYGDTTIARAAANFLETVAHDATLTGNGTSASPLGVASNGVGTSQLANSAVTAPKIATGQVVRSLNGLTDHVILGAGSNISITQSGNTLTIASMLGLTSVAHDSTLQGNGTSGSPLGIANLAVGTNQLANSAVTAPKIATGQVVRSLNGLTDHVILGAGSNISITQSGNTLTIASMLGLTSVAHDGTLQGDGTSGSPLGIANLAVGTNQLANSAITSQKIAAGQVVTSINNLRDNVTLAAGSNITITPSGNTLTIGASTS